MLQIVSEDGQCLVQIIYIVSEFLKVMLPYKMTKINIECMVHQMMEMCVRLFILVMRVSSMFNGPDFHYMWLALGKGTFLSKKKEELLASKESAKLVLSNDAIVALVAASVFAP